MANWSYSQLALYLDCPLKFYWARLDPSTKDQPRDNRRAFIGILLGEVLARLYVEQWWREPGALQARMVAACHTLAPVITQREGIVWATPQAMEEWVTLAVDTVPKILAVIGTEQLLGVTVAVEYGISVPFGGGETVHGRIDLLIVRPDGTILLIDLKAGGSIGKFASPDQLRLYALGILADPVYRRRPDKVGFWWLRHGKIVWKQFTDETLLKFVAGVQQTIARVRAQDFMPRPGSHCRYCDYRAGCATGQAHLWKAFSESSTKSFAADTNRGSIDLSSL